VSGPTNAAALLAAATHPNLFQPSLLRTLGIWNERKSEEHWIIRDAANRQIAASMRATQPLRRG